MYTYTYEWSIDLKKIYIFIFENITVTHVMIIQFPFYYY